MEEYPHNSFNSDPDDQGYSLHEYRVIDDNGQLVPDRHKSYLIKKNGVPQPLPFQIVTPTRAQKWIRDHRE
ncbi:hypothetical protein [Gluconacetobacter entanii]|uniref:hypothetical protein n=1 Tax=Gluconacetobacter entanii TaxID=108528 RepID=UPI001C93556B|nr:hypothetical protein [Gluconacetobacter entanii]MCW4581202.1 hypothetical protein [Gluconacetobacter entanii]MCW4584462.1 hypothetical protein [Gluconacetobacter entanii]